VQAHIVYTGAGPVPPPEARDLPDVATPSTTRPPPSVSTHGCSSSRPPRCR
jgi:hypothetical protein